MNILQLQHRIRYARQRFRCPEIAIIGGYHYANLGDMALGLSVCNTVGSRARAGLQTIYNLEAWPKAPIAILGGGAIIHRATLESIFRRYSPRQVAFCGVDIEDWSAITSFESHLTAITFFSLRSTLQLEMLRRAHPGIHAKYHPDLAFSLASCQRGLTYHDTRRSKEGLINVISRFHLSDPNALCRDCELPEPTPFGYLAGRYALAMRMLVEQLTDQGISLTHVPFTPDDNLVAHHIFTDLKISFSKYNSDPKAVLYRYRKACFSFGSRYHSMIFSMISGVPFSAFAYSSKSARLLSDFPPVSQPFLSITDLLNLPALVAKISSIVRCSSPFCPSLIDKSAISATRGIQAAIASLDVP